MTINNRFARTLVALIAALAIILPALADDTDAAKSAAAASNERSDKDRGRDATRKPDEVLRFMGIEKGMTVLDMFSGGGYYTEVLSAAVGGDGTVYAHNNSAYVAYAKDEIEARFANDRLPNVNRILAENNELDLPAEKFDAATLILAYHDVYYIDEKNNWPEIDGPAMLAEIHAALKPGGILAVIDHVAQSGAPAETGGTLHRIDPERLRKEISAAGFEIDGESDLLRNPDDQHDKPMFDPAVRGKTDRVVIRFRKP